MGWAGAAAAGMQVAGGLVSGLGAIKQSGYDAQAAAMEAAGRAADYRAQGASIAANNRIEALNFDAQADYYLRAAARAQEKGRQERDYRGLQLGQEKGRIMSTAAGSGIDTSSGVVKKAMRDTVRSAYHDMEVSARNEYEEAYGAMKNRAIAKTNAANKRSIADWASAAYAGLAADVEEAGAITARNIQKMGYANAFSSVMGGLTSAAGTLAMSYGRQTVTQSGGPKGNMALNTTSPNSIHTADMIHNNYNPSFIA